MKTITYHTEKEIKIGIMVVIFITIIFTTFRIKELQLNNRSYGDPGRADRTELINNPIPSMPLADADLIEEPDPAAVTLKASGAASANELAVQLKTWINDNAYWSQEEVESDKELDYKMITSLKNGSYFNDETFEELPVSNKAELTTQIKLSLANGDYWNEDNN